MTWTLPITYDVLRVEAHVGEEVGLQGTVNSEQGVLCLQTLHSKSLGTTLFWYPYPALPGGNPPLRALGRASAPPRRARCDACRPGPPR